MLVYIAGPYTADPERCVMVAIAALHEVMDAGHNAFVPHLSHFAEMQQPRHYEDWMRMCLDMVPRCDMLWRLPGQSPGADREVALAAERGMMIIQGGLGTARSFFRYMEGTTCSASEFAAAQVAFGPRIDITKSSKV
jgi:hypothetical protein